MRRALFLTSAAVLALGLAACKSEPEAEGKAKAAFAPSCPSWSSRGASRSSASRARSSHASRPIAAFESWGA